MKALEFGALIAGIVLALVMLWGVTYDLLDTNMLYVLTAAICLAVIVAGIAGQKVKKQEKNKSKKHK